MRRRKRPGEYRRRVTVDSQEQTALSAARDQRIEVGAGGKVVRQGILRERNATEYRGSARSTPPGLQIEADAAPRVAGSKSGAIDASRLGPGGTSVKSGRDHRHYNTGRRRLGGFGHLVIKRRDCAGPPCQPGHTSHTRQVLSTYRKPIGIHVSYSGNAARGFRAERLAHEPVECGVIYSGVGRCEESRTGS